MLCYVPLASLCLPSCDPLCAPSVWSLASEWSLQCKPLIPAIIGDLVDNGNLPGSAVIQAMDKPSPDVNEMVGAKVQIPVSVGGLPVDGNVQGGLHPPTEWDETIILD